MVEIGQLVGHINVAERGLDDAFRGQRDRLRLTPRWHQAT